MMSPMASNPSAVLQRLQGKLQTQGTRHRDKPLPPIECIHGPSIEKGNSSSPVPMLPQAQPYSPPLPVSTEVLIPQVY